MDSFLLYLLKVSAAIMFFYLCYILFFSRDTFYLRNRIFLIGLLLLSIIIPLLKSFNFFAADSTIKPANSMSSFILSGTSIGATVSEKIISFDLNNLFISLYFSISSLFILRALTSVARTITLTPAPKYPP